MRKAIEPTLEGSFTFARSTPFELECGGALQPVTLRYAVYGELNAERDNAVLACHALTGSARVGDWWDGLFRPAEPHDPPIFDLRHDCVIGVNVLGSCYDSTGPASANPQTGQPYGPEFPLVTVRDIVRAQARLIEHLGIGRLRLVLGGSIGGMQALQWAIDHPDRVERCIVIGATALSPMGLALNHLQRQAIRLDPAWHGGRYAGDERPRGGLALARAIAMCSYKSAGLFDERFGRKPNRGEDPWSSEDARFDVAGYLDHQGDKLVDRFDANSYLVLSKAMDLFEPGRGYGSEREALRRIRARVLLVGISSDWLFPAEDVAALSGRMQAAGVECEYAELVSDHGHDAFLADTHLLAPLLKTWLDNESEAEMSREVFVEEFHGNRT